MSFVVSKDSPSEGDTVIVYLSFNLFYPLVLKAGETFQTKYGAVRHNDLIGKTFGSKIQIKNGYVHMLQPTAELWTMSLPHRTQILYTRDISYTIFQLGLQPGSVVVESGTGSGSMTHSLARAVAPSGKVYTFDFHKVRSDTAREEFASHGLSDLVECGHADACVDGFGLDGVADAVFLDLPHPWLALEHAIKALKPTGGRICTFSPCIEQVQKSCEKMRELRLLDIDTVECLERSYEVKRAHFAEQTSGKQDWGWEYFVGGQEKKEEILGKASNGSSNEEKMETGDGEVAEDATGEDDKTEEKSAKKGRFDKRGRREQLPGETLLTAVPSMKMPGHTGYLTFATYIGRNTSGETKESAIAV